MSNKQLFKSYPGPSLKPTDCVNEAGGRAYKMSDKEALLQFVMTGTFNGTYYKSEKDILNELILLLSRIDNAFIIKAAIYSREKGKMKDMPSFLVAYLGNLVGNETESVKQIWKNLFFKVIDNGRMLRNFVQMIRSGVLPRVIHINEGLTAKLYRKSFGSTIKKALQQWLNDVNERVLINAYIGNAPTLEQIINMVHVKGKNPERQTLFKWIKGKGEEINCYNNLPIVFKRYNAIKSAAKTMPNFPIATYGTDYKDGIPFQLLTNLDLPIEHWKHILKTMPINTLRMNLNHMARKGIFKLWATEFIPPKVTNTLDNEMVDFVAERMVDEQALSYVLPYQLFTTYMNLDTEVPAKINYAVQKSVNIAMRNIEIDAKNVVIGVDVSGSMDSAITGNRGSATTVVKCNQVAALIACAYMSKVQTNENLNVWIIAFDTNVKDIKLNPMDTIVTNANILANCGRGGTDCSLPFLHVIKHKIPVDLMLLISDNESWIETKGGYNISHTNAQVAWRHIHKEHPKSKLVCIDLQPNSSVQVQNDKSVMNIGGFSDEIFSRINDFWNNKEGETAKTWVEYVEKIELPINEKVIDKCNDNEDNELSREY